MIQELERIVDELGVLHSKLILLTGKPGAGKSVLLQALGRSRRTEPLNVGLALGKRLSGMAQRQRILLTPTVLRELADQRAAGDLLLLDNIELLFDRSLQLDPLDLLKRHAHARRVVAVWPGELQGDARTGRLTYADMAHPEHRLYNLAGVVPFEVE